MIGSPTFQSFNTLELDVILLVGEERNQPASRKITSIYGLPFYCSTGINSQFPGTWFPFYGVAPYGYFVKKLTSPENLPPLFYKLFVPYQAYQDANADLPARFGSLACLLLSSCFGGGLWDTEKGQQLKQSLECEHADFYQKWPNMLLNEPEKKFDQKTLFQINDWLTAKAMVIHPKELIKLHPTNVEDLLALKVQDEQKKQIQNQPNSCCRLV